MNHSSSVDASEGEGITDTDELEGRVTVDTNEEQEVMSPGARARAVRPNRLFVFLLSPFPAFSSPSSRLHLLLASTVHV